MTTRTSLGLSRNICFHRNDLRQAKKGCQLYKTFKARAVRTQNNLGPEKLRLSEPPPRMPLR
jgi:hypothetical protein